MDELTISVPEAGNGLYGRRQFIRGGLASATLFFSAGAAGQIARTPGMQSPGGPMSDAGAPAPYEAHVQRTSIASQPGTHGSGASRTPLQYLDGLVTPSRLHFERHHAGIPDIDPTAHRLYIHGLVEQPLVFSLDALMRYPMVSQLQFLECSGNSAALTAPEAAPLDCATIHGLISTSEWGGVPLSILLEEAGVKPEGKWVVADGADAAVLNRSVPMRKIMDDAIVALYQNGERLRPANGYPMRLFLPGWEGNASIKWLRSLKVTSQPAMSKNETSKYSDLDAAGQAKLFTFAMGVKSVITSPSPGLSMHQPGMYQISGMAWSGSGRIRQVEVSADGGQSWVQAQLDQHVLPKCVTRFRAAWRWQGQGGVLMSRATDEHGEVQPSRTSNMHNRGVGGIYHVNAIQAWAVDGEGKVSNVYV